MLIHVHVWDQLKLLYDEFLENYDFLEMNGNIHRYPFQLRMLVHAKFSQLSTLLDRKQ